MRTLRLPLVAALVSASIGCTPPTPTFTGTVTTLGPRLCLGRPQATGDCFDVPASLLTGRRIGDCLTVEYVENPSVPGPRGTATKVEASTGCDW